jgi:hypothetical protein
METLTLDGQPITLAALQEKMKDHSIRITEVAPGQYKTLQAMKG